MFNNTVLCGQGQDATLMFWHIPSGCLIATHTFSDKVNFYQDGDSHEAVFIDQSGSLLKIDLEFEPFNSRPKPNLCVATGDQRTYENELLQLQFDVHYLNPEPPAVLENQISPATWIVLSLAIGGDLRGIESVLQQLPPDCRIFIYTTPTAIKRRGRYICQLRSRYAEIVAVTSTAAELDSALQAALHHYWFGPALINRPTMPVLKKPSDIQKAEATITQRKAK